MESGWNSGMAAEGADQGRVLAQRTPPAPALGHERPDDDGLGLHATDQAQRRRERGTGGDDVVDDRHPPAPHGVDPGRIHAAGAAACPS